MSLRVRCELLDMELPPPPPPKRPPKPKLKGPRKVQNPWYLPAKKWYSLHDKLDNPEERIHDFPYANVIYNLSDAPKRDDQAQLAPQWQKEKESLGIVEAYKIYMKGNRLPHFLL